MSSNGNGTAPKRARTFAAGRTSAECGGALSVTQKAYCSDRCRRAAAPGPASVGAGRAVVPERGAVEVGRTNRRGARRRGGRCTRGLAAAAPAGVVGVELVGWRCVRA